MLLTRVLARYFWLALPLILLLAACQSAAQPAPLTGTGALEGRTVVVASELGGRIAALAAQEGDRVAAGEVLVRLDDGETRAQVAQTAAAVAAAEASLAQLRAGPRDAELAAAEAALELAQAQAHSAERDLLYAREAITNPIELDIQITQARLQRDIAEQRIEGARAELAAEELRRHIYVDLKENVSAETRRSWDLRIAAAQGAITHAEAERDAAQADLNALYDLRANPLENVALLRGAQAAYTATLAAVDTAQAELTRLRDLPRAEEVRIAEAHLTQARAAHTLALTQQSMLTLTAPISGVVASRNYHVGEIAPAGRAIVTLVDMETIHLTLYVAEDRIGEVAPGQRAEVRVDTHPGERFVGTVERIASEAEYTPGSVDTAGDRARRVFAVRIRIPNPEHRLRPGIPATATLLP